MTDTSLAGPAAGFQEASSESQVQAVPLAHLSIEVGHFYRDDLLAGPERVRRRFEEVTPWVEAARQTVGKVATGRPRVSTCFLLDDYSAELPPPSKVLPDLVRAARETGLEIDYLAREAACVDADGVPLARLVEDRIVADPPPGSDGSRPPVTESGWLCNGQRTPAATTAAAMELAADWTPPVENAAERHSIFVDVELWDEPAGTRTWSCAYLASVWQLLRLGLLRWRGARVALPQPWREPLPESWGEVPAIIQVNQRAAPFSAYRAISVLPRQFLATEHAVLTILGQVAVDPAVVAQVMARAGAEGIELPAEPVDRISYVFTS